MDELIRDKVKDYAAQGLTYEQAAEELVADSWRGIFDSAEACPVGEFNPGAGGEERRQGRHHPQGDDRRGRRC